MELAPTNLFVAFLGALFGGGADGSGGGAQPAQALAAAADPTPTYLVGRLTEEGARRCDPDGTEHYSDLHWEAGFVRVSSADGNREGLRPHEGKAVVLQGHVAPPAPPAAAQVQKPAAGPGQLAPGEPAWRDPCPIHQARSDMRFGKSGMRLERSRPAGAAWAERFVADDARPFDELKVRRVGDELVVRLKNRFPFPLTGLVLQIHYEGCYGKPGSVDRNHDAGTLHPGSTVEVRFPTFAERAHQRGHRHAASSVRVTSLAPQVIFDLSVPVGAWDGAAVECRR